MKIKSLIISAVAAAALPVAAGAAGVEVRLGAKGAAEIPPTLYGLFFEDINYAADGGLYAEKVINRSFEFPQSLMGWNVSGNVEVRSDGPFDRAPHYVRLSPSGHRHKHTALENEGFFGVSAEKGKEYRLSLWGRAEGADSARIRVEIADPASMGETHVLAKADIRVAPGDWRKYEVTLKPSRTVEKGRLRIFLVHPDRTVDLEHISLMPADTWKGRRNGLRADLAQKLADLHPGVFRFPGGCIVEGTDLGSRYRWKNTVGPVENRPVNENRWHYTFAHRFYPDYYQSGGLGFYEFFELSEDLGAAPLPVLSVGLSCQYQNNGEECHVPVDSLQPYIDDALDLIEFANGDTTTVWGGLRAEMGHPAPFGLKYIGIGNEQWGPEYVERLKPFISAIRSRYPDIRIVGSSGPNPDGERFDMLWEAMTDLGADLVDEHFYRPEDWFAKSPSRYDSYSRKAPKVFAGEYACHGKGKKYNHFNAALLEAAFLTGVERNADIVEMATYAPLFAHVEGWQWRPDLIWFDNLRSMPTSSYHVQKLYADNKGARVAPVTLTGADSTLFVSAVTDTSGDIIVKAVNLSDAPVPLDFTFNPGKNRKLKAQASPAAVTVTTLHAEAMDENTLDSPDRVCPAVSEAAYDGETLTLPAKTFAVYRFTH